ncbi:GxxExxY protein [Endothiovibrio diazotrophicus]
MDENQVASDVIGAAIEVHRMLGPGLLESAYQDCLSHELGLRKIPHECEVVMPVAYKGIVVQHAYRSDLIVANRVVVELKAVDAVQPVHKAQLLTYLRLSGLKLGLLINFNAVMLKKGIHRIVNKL